jgi:hypothetical protein
MVGVGTTRRFEQRRSRAAALAPRAHLSTLRDAFTRRRPTRRVTPYGIDADGARVARRSRPPFRRATAGDECGTIAARAATR